MRPVTSDAVPPVSVYWMAPAAVDWSTSDPGCRVPSRTVSEKLSVRVSAVRSSWNAISVGASPSSV